MRFSLHARQIRKGEDGNAGANVSVRRFFHLFRCVRLLSEASVGPIPDMIKEICARIAVVGSPMKRGARRAWRQTVGGALDHHIILIAACRHFEDLFSVANEVMTLHR